MSESNYPYNYALRLLTGKDYSEKKLREKLKLKKFTPEEIKTVIDKLNEQGFIREEAYVEARTKAYMNRGYSKNFIKRKISGEVDSLNSDEIEEVFEENQVEEEDQIKKLIIKKMPKIKPKSFEERKKANDKVMRFLMSKGHSPSKAFQYIKKFMYDTQEDEQFSFDHE